MTLCLWLKALFQAGEKKFGTDEQEFVTILGNRSAEHLRKGVCLFVGGGEGRGIIQVSQILKVCLCCSV